MSIRYEWTPSPSGNANVWDNVTSHYVCRDVPSEIAEDVIRKLNAHDALVAALESVETAANLGVGPACAVCHALKKMGHYNDCVVGAALKLAKEGRS